MNGDQRLTPLIIIALCCLVLIETLTFYGVILSAIIVMVTAIVIRRQPDKSEMKAMMTSIMLSADDIADVLDQYKKFLTGSKQEYLMDRTVHRPALTDRDCQDPAISEFFFQYDAASRFLDRLEAKMNASQSLPELEMLLAVTDRRAVELKEAWSQARKAALRLGNGPA